MRLPMIPIYVSPQKTITCMAIIVTNPLNGLIGRHLINCLYKYTEKSSSLWSLFQMNMDRVMRKGETHVREILT